MTAKGGVRPRAGWLAGALALLAGCAAGPDFIPPAAPTVARYTDDDAPRLPGQSLRTQAPGRRWWTAFGTPALDAMVSDALERHPSAAAAQAAVEQAHQVVAAARGSDYPRMSLGLSAARGNDLDDRMSHVSSERSLGPALSWSPDVSGASARRQERAQALLDEQDARRDGAELDLVTAVAVKSIELACAHDRLRAMREAAGASARTLALAQRALAAGRGTRSEVRALELQVADDDAEVATLESADAQARHALSILTGHLPGEWTPPALELAAITLPAALPLRVPSELVRARPDLRAAEARLHAASAGIGIASAGLYPSVTLDSGWTVAAAPATLANGGQGVWSLAATLLAPVFDGRVLAAQKRAAVAAYAGQLADYRTGVLRAFADVADAMRRLERDASVAQIREGGLRAADDAAAAGCESHGAGRGTLAGCLQATRDRALAEASRAEAQGEWLADSARWFAAMGGGAPGQAH